LANGSTYTSKYETGMMSGRLSAGSQIHLSQPLGAMSAQSVASLSCMSQLATTGSMT
jgi:hypothetical protein